MLIVVMMSGQMIQRVELSTMSYCTVCYIMKIFIVHLLLVVLCGH